MRPGYYTEADGTVMNGHWHHTSIKAGDFWQSRKTDKWFVVESVIHTSSPYGDGNNWFCHIREATPAELDARLKPNPEAEMNDLFDLFSQFDK